MRGPRVYVLTYFVDPIDAWERLVPVAHALTGAPLQAPRELEERGVRAARRVRLVGLAHPLAPARRRRGGRIGGLQSRKSKS